MLKHSEEDEMSVPYMLGKKVFIFWIQFRWSQQSLLETLEVDAAHPIFPPDYHYETYRWEDDVIYDPEHAPKSPGKFFFVKF